HKFHECGSKSRRSSRTFERKRSRSLPAPCTTLVSSGEDEMSKALAQLLDQPQTVAESAIAKLEHLSGYQSTDVQLLSEITTKVRAKTKQLGLDPNDTTAEELYHSLQAKLRNDNERFAEKAGLSSVKDGDEYITHFLEFIQRAPIHPEV